LNFATFSKDLLHVFIYCDFVLHAVHGTETYCVLRAVYRTETFFVLGAVHGTETCAFHETETYFQLSQHLLLDQSPYSGLVKLMVYMV
jgi:hypothetical protein